MSGKKTSW